MADQYSTSMIDSTRNLSFDTVTLLTTSTINTLHFPGLSTSGISESAGSRRTSILLDGFGMCESMTDSVYSTGGTEDGLINQNSIDLSGNHPSKIERRDSTKKRRSRKAQYDASIDSPSLDKIETVNVIGEQNEADDAWLFEIPKSAEQTNVTKDNIISWVHKEFKSNDINASKHRLLCKLDDMSNARTIRSVSCHNFLDNQRSNSSTRSPTEQHVRSEPVKNGRMSSPLRTLAPSFNEHENPRSPLQSPTLRSNVPMTNINGNHSNNGNTNGLVRSREVSRERLDYTDLEVLAKIQLENLRQAERQGPLSKQFGGSNASLASTSSGTSVGVPNRSTNKPPIAPKSTVTRSTIKPNTYQRSNTQTIVSNSCDGSNLSESKTLVTLKTRVSLLPPNSANNNNRTRPSTTITTRPIQPYRGSQTTFHSTVSKIQTAAPSSSVQRNGKTFSHEFNSTSTGKEFSSHENGLLHDVSNRPSTAPVRSQLGSQRRTILPQISTEQTPPVINGQTTLSRSSSSLSQGRKSGIPMVGKPQKPSTATVTRPKRSNGIPASKSSDNLTVTKTFQTQRTNAFTSKSKEKSSWNDGYF